MECDTQVCGSLSSYNYDTIYQCKMQLLVASSLERIAVGICRISKLFRLFAMALLTKSHNLADRLRPQGQHHQPVEAQGAARTSRHSALLGRK